MPAIASHPELAYDGVPRLRVNSVQAAEIAGVTERTIYNWLKRGAVEYVRTPTGGVRIYVDTLLCRVQT